MLKNCHQHTDNCSYTFFYSEKLCNVTISNVNYTKLVSQIFICQVFAYVSYCNTKQTTGFFYC